LATNSFSKSSVETGTLNYALEFSAGMTLNSGKNYGKIGPEVLKSGLEKALGQGLNTSLQRMDYS